MTQDELKRLVRYEDGKLYWLETGTGRKAGAIGYVENHGYRRVKIEGIRYLVHRLVWLFFHGVMPENMIDHIDGNRDNNRVENLREVTNAENLQNQTKAMNTNLTGFLGVSFKPHFNKYIARIRKDGKLTHLGSFNTAEEAHQAYLIAKASLHPFGTISKEQHVN
jgi:hypothetical protein